MVTGVVGCGPKSQHMVPSHRMWFPESPDVIPRVAGVVQGVAGFWFSGSLNVISEVTEFLA